MKPCYGNFQNQIPNNLEFYFAITLDNNNNIIFRYFILCANLLSIGIRCFHFYVKKLTLVAPKPKVRLQKEIDRNQMDDMLRERFEVLKVSFNNSHDII